MPADAPVIAVWIKPVVLVTLLSVLWLWEGLQPYLPLFGEPRERRRHAGRNLAITVGNTAVLALMFGSATVAVTTAASQRNWGLLPWIEPPEVARWLLAVVLLDGWLYLWHRANHRVPWLWRFHRMHHSDPQMDVTTATRFHLGEHAQSSLLRLAVIPALGVTAPQIALYDTLVIANTLLHHANVSLGGWDRWLRLVLVTPDMHKVHHSRLQAETDSNYATVLSVWDRLGRSFAMRENCATIRFGLEEFDGPGWQTLPGLLKTPLAPVPPSSPHAGAAPTSPRE